MSQVYRCPGCGKLVVSGGEPVLPVPAAKVEFLCPHCDGIFPLNAFADAGIPRLIPLRPKSASRPSVSVSKVTSEEASFETIEVPAAEKRATAANRRPTPSTATSVPTGSASLDDASRPTFSFGTRLSAEEERLARESAASALSRLEQHRRGPRLVKQILALGLGGLLLVAVGYVTLNYFWGVDVDWIGITTARNGYSILETGING